MALPASENTLTLRQAYVSKEHVTGDDHIKVGAQGSAVNQGDFVLSWPFFGVADNDMTTTSAETDTIHVGQVYNVAAAKIGASQTFYTLHQAVYYDPADGLLYEASATGRCLVGYVRQVASASVVPFAFEGLRIAGAMA